MSKPIILYGNRALASMLYLEARDDPGFEIGGFCVDRAYLDPDGQFMGLAQIAFDEIELRYPPEAFDMMVLEGLASDQDKGNPLTLHAKAKGYRLRNYLSPGSLVSPDIRMGENNVVFAQSYLGEGGSMGNGNIIRQQVYLGHDFNLGDAVILNPGVKIGGSCRIEDRCFLGLGAIVIDHIQLAHRSLIGAGSVVIRDTEPDSRNVGNPSQRIGHRSAL